MTRRLLIAMTALALSSAGAWAQTTTPLTTLPAQAAGVIGSGEDMVLSLRTPTGSRILKVGDVFEDGWRLSALTNSVATFSRQGESRSVGLNPAGAVAQAAEAGNARVSVMGGSTALPTSLTDTIRIFSTHPADRQAAIAANGGVMPARPRVGDITSDGWTVMDVLGFQLIFERNGVYQSVGLFPDAAPVMGLPDQIFPAPGRAMLYTRLDLPEALADLPDLQRRSAYGRLIEGAQADVRASRPDVTVPVGVASIDIQQMFGFEAYFDYRAVSQLDRGPAVLMTGVGTLREALLSAAPGQAILLTAPYP